MKFVTHRLINNQVKAADDTPILPSKNSFPFSKKKKCDNILREWQVLFTSSQKKEQLFLDFENEKQCTIKPTYAKGGSWLSFIGFTNALCAHFTHMTTDHASIGKYCQCFFPKFVMT